MENKIFESGTGNSMLCPRFIFVQIKLIDGIYISGNI